jgi:hypothetical protein
MKKLKEILETIGFILLTPYWIVMAGYVLYLYFTGGFDLY